MEVQNFIFLKTCISMQTQRLNIVRDSVLQQLVCFTYFCVVIYVPSHVALINNLYNSFFLMLMNEVQLLRLKLYHVICGI